MKKWILSISWVLCVWSTWAGTYSDWASANGNLSALGDADQDGMVNLVEFATASDPQIMDSFLFSIGQQHTNSVVRWHQRQQMSDVIITLEGKTDLSTDWTAVAIDPANRSVTSIDADTEEISVTLNNTGSAYFVRLQVALQGGVTPVTSYVYPSSAILVATPSDEQVSLVWNSVSSVNDYVVYYSTSAGVSTNGAAVHVSGNQTTISGLTNDQPYYFSVQANEGNGSGSWLSEEVRAIPFAQAVSLDAPSNLVAMEYMNEITLSWDPVSGATGYNLYWSTNAPVRRTDAMQANVTAPFVHSGVQPELTYYYAVEAVDASGHSRLSDSVSAATLGVLTVAPENLQARGETGQIVLSWDPVPGVSSYAVHSKSGFPYAVRSSDTLLATVSSTQYVHTVSDGGYHSYSIRALYGNSAYDMPPPVAAKAYDQSFPDLFFNSPAVIPGDEMLEVHWKISDSFTEPLTFNLMWGTEAVTNITTDWWGYSTTNFIPVYSHEVEGLTDTKYQHTGLTNGTPYFYGIKAIHSTAGTNVYDKVAYGVPSANAAPVFSAQNHLARLETISGDGQVTIDWDLLDVNCTYKLYRSPYDTMSPRIFTDAHTVIFDQVTPPFVDTSVVNGNMYYYYLEAYNAQGSDKRYGGARATPQRVAVPPPAYAGTISVQTANRQLTLSWPKNSDAGRYVVYWSENAAVTKASARIEVLSPSFVHTGLENGKTYYYAMSQVNRAGESDLSSIVSGTPQASQSAPAVPQNLGANYVGYRRAALSWDAAPGATGYLLLWNTGTSLAAHTAMIDVGAKLNYIHSGLSAGTDYTYAVVAYNGSGTSSTSSPETFRPTHKDGMSALSGSEMQYNSYLYVGGSFSSNVSHRIWVPDHLKNGATPVRAFVTGDRHGAMQGFDRHYAFRLFAEKNDAILIRYHAMESEEVQVDNVRRWLNETLGGRQDLSQVAHVSMGLSQAAGGLVTSQDRTLAQIFYAQPSGSSLRNPVLMPVGAKDRYAIGAGETDIQNNSVRGTLSGCFFFKDQDHNTIGNSFYVTRWIEDLMNLRLQPDGSIDHGRIEGSAHVLFDGDYEATGELKSISNVSVDPHVDPFKGEVWMPSETLANEWKYAVGHPYAYWIETPAADQIPVNMDTTLSTRVGDINIGGHVARLEWSQQSGPGTATISTQKGEVIGAFTFPKTAGIYEMRITLTVDGSTSSHDLSFTHNGKYESTLSKSFPITGQNITSISWSQQSGPATASLGSIEINMDKTVQFDAPGTYVVRMTVGDDEGNTRTYDQTIEVR